MRNISFLTYNDSFFFSFEEQSSVFFTCVDISVIVWYLHNDWKIRLQPVFINRLKDIEISAAQGESSSCSSSSLSRTCGIGTRNVISREIGQPVRRLTSTWLSVLLLRFSFFPPLRALAYVGTVFLQHYNRRTFVTRTNWDLIN